MDWESDPELKKMRNEFIQSFPDRLKKLDEGSDVSVAIHQLAGSAGSYGFAVVSRISEELDDFISLGGVQRFPQLLHVFLPLLKEVLIDTNSRGCESEFFLKDSRMAKLTSVVELLRAEATF